MNTQPYTPTTEEVREYVANGGEYRPWVAPNEAVESARTAAFDRWLAQHDREVAAKALRDHRRRVSRFMPAGLVDRATVLADLDDYADRIERGEV